MTGLKAFTSTSLPPEVPNLQRLISAGIVVLLHLWLLWLFLHAKPIVFPIRPPSFHSEPITLWLTLPKPGPAEKSPDKADTKEKKRAQSIAPPVLKGLGMPLPPPPAASPAPGADYTGLRALGRYLNNCSGMYYEALGQHDLSHCLANQWDIPMGSGDPNLRLGAEAPSVWQAERDRHNAPYKPPMGKECAANSRQSNLGLPCLDLTQ